MCLIRINSKDNHQEKLNEIKEMIAVAKLEKMTILEQQVKENFDFIRRENSLFSYVNVIMKFFNLKMNI
jgi:hypothetical protein